jgi:hypothetical protein
MDFSLIPISYRFEIHFFATEVPCRFSTEPSPYPFKVTSMPQLADDPLLFKRDETGAFQGCALQLSDGIHRSLQVSFGELVVL